MQVQKGVSRPWILCLLSFGLAFAAPAQSVSDSVRITEFMASNNAVLFDEDGEASDWIEIHNNSASAVNLQGWFLTDNNSNLVQWQLPGVELPPGGYQIVFASGKDRVPEALFWETVIDWGDEWRYFPGQSEPPGDWLDNGFDDSAWQTGPSGFGYGDNDDATAVPNPILSVYVRKTFNLTDAREVRRAFLHVDYDDAFVAYLNGVEIARANIGQRNIRPKFDDGANGPIEPFLAQGQTLPEFEISNIADLFRDGENVLAIQGHNVSLQSSDFTLIPFLTLALTAQPAEPRGAVEQVLPLPGEEIHANFRLSGGGEFLALVEPDGQTLASVFDPYPEQLTDISYGLKNEEIGYLEASTPGAANSNLIAGFAAEPEFSVEHGFYETPFLLTLSSGTQDAQIRYTLDGSTPTVGSARYQDPILIERTTVVRAIATRPGFRNSQVMTQTFLFLDDIVRQSLDGRAPEGWPNSWGGNVVDYGMDPVIIREPGSEQREAVLEALVDLPSFSLVTDLPHLFDENNGIYANAWNRGRDWERPVSVELIYPDGETGFQINAGARIRGGFSRSGDNPKHAFRLFFRNEYGSSKLRYPLFGDEGVDEFDNIDLRTSQNYSWSFRGSDLNTMNRDVFSRDLQREQGMPYTRSRYYHLYLNGQYWGLFQTQERSEASFGASYYGGQPEQYDVIKATPDYNIEATDGNLDAWIQFWQLTNAIADAATEEERHTLYLQAQGLAPDGLRNPAFPVFLDVDNLVHYMLAIFYPGNRDAPVTLSSTDVNNFYALRNREGEQGFVYFTHDNEHSLLALGDNRTGPLSAGHAATDINPQWFHQQLTNVEEYRMRFADIAHKHFFDDGLFTPESGVKLFQQRAGEIENAIVAESARWGDAKRDAPFTKNDWQNRINSLVNEYFPSRSNTVLNQLRNARRWNDWRTRSSLRLAPLYPSVQTPVFNQHGGSVAAGFELIMTSSADSVFYTIDGTDPRLMGGAIYSGTLVYQNSPVVLNGRTLVKSRARKDGEWSALNEATFFVNAEPPAAETLTISEIHYNPSPPSAAEIAAGFEDNDEFEFIELANLGQIALDLAEVSISGGIHFTFFNRSLEPGQRVVLVENADAFGFRYGDELNIGGQYQGKLNNAGEKVLLSFGREILHSITYNDAGLWPSLADGAGSSLEIVDPSGDKNDPANWRASREFGGTPGFEGAGDSSGVVINEILSHTDAPLLDAIELFNASSKEIDISGWFLSDSRNFQKFVIPAGTIIPAGGYVVFDESHFNASGGATDFALDGAHGDQVWLLEGDESGKLLRFIDNVTFGATANGETLGRWPNGEGELFPMIEPTLNEENTGPRVGPLVIREIMYHPPNNNRDLEYLEIFNAGAETQDLTNWRLNDGVDFTFPTGYQLPAGESVVVLSFDPVVSPDKLSAFRSAFSFADSVPLLGGWTGRLENLGEPLALTRPDAPPDDEPEFIPQILVDRVHYKPESPWPIEPAGEGYALVRVDPLAFAQDTANWRAQERYQTPTDTKEPEEEIEITEFAVSNVYPNPARETAVFTLALVETQNVTIKVYDILGRLVENLHQSVLEGGQAHRFEFGNARLASGVYLVKIVGESFQETRKVLFVR